MEREKSKSNYLFGLYVDKRRFWLIFTLMLVFFTSPIAHLPYFFGYGLYTCFVVGVIAVGFNVLIPLLLAHWAWVQKGMSEVPDDKRNDEIRD